MLMSLCASGSNGEPNMRTNKQKKRWGLNQISLTAYPPFIQISFSPQLVETNEPINKAEECASSLTTANLPIPAIQSTTNTQINLIADQKCAVPSSEVSKRIAVLEGYDLYSSDFIK